MSKNRQKSSAEMSADFDAPNALLSDILALGLLEGDERARRLEIIEIMKEHNIKCNKTWREPLINYFKDWIKAHSTVSFQRANTRRLVDLFNKLGEVNHNNTPKTSTFNKQVAGPMRAILKEHFTLKRSNGETLGEYLSSNTKITDTERTKLQNETQDNRAKLRKRAPYVISLERVERLLSDMYTDVMNDHKDSVFLLVELISGCRTGESVSASVFTKGETNGYDVPFITQQGIFKKRDDKIPYANKKKGRGHDSDSDNSDTDDSEQRGKGKSPESYHPKAIISKPMLDFPSININLKLVLEKLDKEREKNEIIVGTQDVGAINTIGKRLREMLKLRYLPPREGDLKKLGTHLLRSLYVNTAYKIYVETDKLPVSTLHAFIADYLGHASDSIAERYSDVIIRPPTKTKPDPAIINIGNQKIKEEKQPEEPELEESGPPDIPEIIPDRFKKDSENEQLRKENTQLKKKLAALDRKLKALIAALNLPDE